MENCWDSYEISISTSQFRMAVAYAGSAGMCIMADGQWERWGTKMLE